MSQIRSCYKPHTISSSEGELVFSPPLGGGLVGSGASGGEYLVVVDLYLQGRGSQFPPGEFALEQSPNEFCFLTCHLFKEALKGKELTCWD